MQLNFNLFEEDLPLILKNPTKSPAELDYLPDDCIVTDIETTGLNPIKDTIIEISALKIKDKKVIGEFSTLINPKVEISYFITKLTGITNADVKGAPNLKEALKDFCNFVSDYPIVGHNIKFDLSFINVNLKREFKRSLPNDFADTLFFSKLIYNELKSHKLTTIAKHLKIDTNGAHRALNDCCMTYKVMLDLYGKLAAFNHLVN